MHNITVSKCTFKLKIEGEIQKKFKHCAVSCNFYFYFHVLFFLFFFLSFSSFFFRKNKKEKSIGMIGILGKVNNKSK